MEDLIKKEIIIHKELISNFENNDIKNITKIAEDIIKTIKNGGYIYLCGNGGSASDAQHIAGELIGRFKKNRRPLPAIALSSDVSVLTCIGNDFGFDEIFSRQAEALITNNDILWIFSTSGESPNIIKTILVAKEKKAMVIAFIGKTGSTIEKITDLCLIVNSENTDKIQEVHQLAYHIICKLIDKKFS